MVVENAGGDNCDLPERDGFVPGGPGEETSCEKTALALSAAVIGITHRLEVSEPELGHGTIRAYEPVQPVRNYTVAALEEHEKFCRGGDHERPGRLQVCGRQRWLKAKLSTWSHNERERGDDKTAKL